MNKIERRGKILSLLCIVFTLTLQARAPRYWIQFKDKKDIGFSVDRPSEFLSPAAIERRAKYNIAVVESDLPVNTNYVSAVEQISNAHVVYASKWFNGVVIEVTDESYAAGVLSAINQLPFVIATNPIKLYKVAYGTPSTDKTQPPPLVAEKEQTTTNSSAFQYGGSGAQIRQLGLECLHNKGFRGQGITIAVLDAGFGYGDINPVFDSLRNRNGVVAMRDFVSGGNNAYQGGTHGTMVLSCMAANVPGLIHGTAPLANYILLRTEAPGEYITEEYNWIRGAEFADSAGAHILTTSLGYTEFDDAEMNHTYATLNGKTAPMSIAATMAARKGLLVLNAAGNERASTWHFIGVPADADSIVTVGAIDSLGKEAAFSSVGPTADGRIKPDFVAIGAGSWVSEINTTCFPANGTSFATPILAGALACYWQAHPEFSSVDLIRFLRATAANAKAPNNTIGWGVPNLCEPAETDFQSIFTKSTGQLDVLFMQNFTGSTFEIIDVSGKILYSTILKNNERKITTDASRFYSPVIIMRLRSPNGTIVKKQLFF